MVKCDLLLNVFLFESFLCFLYRKKQPNISDVEKHVHSLEICRVNGLCFKHTSEGHETTVDGGTRGLPKNVTIVQPSLLEHKRNTKSHLNKTKSTIKAIDSKIALIQW